MLTPAVLLSLLVAALVACRPGATASGPRVERRRARERDRRLRHVDRHPRQVDLDDIETLMRVHELPEEEIRLLSARARSRGIRPLTMWAWSRQRGVHTLAVVVAADLSDEELVAHLADGTVPDLAELEVYAALHGLSVAAGQGPGTWAFGDVRDVLGADWTGAPGTTGETGCDGRAA